MVAATAACSGGDDPEASPAPSVTESASPSPSVSPGVVSPPNRPAEMERTDEAGAAAAAEYFMQLFAYVMQTGDLEEWDRVSAQDCGFCNKTSDRVSSTYGAGGRFVGGVVTVGAFEPLGYDATLGAYALGTPYTFSSGTELSADGHVLEDIAEESGYAVLDVVFTSQGWTLLGLSVGQEPPP